MPPKRKRDNKSSDAGENRPSPHRPGNAALAQHDKEPDTRDGGNRRSSRGGQGGGRGRRNDRRNSSNTTQLSTARATPTPGPMSPLARQSSATQPTTPASTTEVSLPTPRVDRRPFDYSFITEGQLSSWDTRGRQEVVSKGTQARQDEDMMDLSMIFQEFIRSTLDGRLDAAQAGACVREILGPETAPEDSSDSALDPQTLFLDTFSMICEAEDLTDSHQNLRAFVVSTGISALVMRENLDASLLETLQLTRNTFIRVGIRQATHLLYRQANYNLLREETEGYSKLVAELFSISDGGQAYIEVVEDAFEKIKGLIGTFDLDVGRVLDITMDVFASLLIKNYRFFVKLLRVSSWWPRNGVIGANDGIFGGLPRWALPSSQGYTTLPEDEEASREQRLERDILFWDRVREVGIDAFFELGGRQSVDEESKQRIFKGEVDAELDADRQWIEITGTLPPSGNRVAAQLLGFKLRFYASEARNNEDVLPDNLIYMTALLIKIGFISLKDLYPHIWPQDDGMEALREERQQELDKEKANRSGGQPNALMRAGALPDDDPPPSQSRTRELKPTPDPSAKATAEVEDKNKLTPPLEQKVRLLKSLLTIGAVPESLFILSRFPWLPEVYPDLYDLIHRILNHSLQKVYDSTRPSKPEAAAHLSKKLVDFDQSGMPKGSIRLIQMPPRSQLRWPFADKFDTNESKNYRFYWDEWADNIHVCQTVDDVFTLCGSLLNISGVNIGRDAVLLSKLARIGTTSLQEDHSIKNLDRWHDLLKRLLVPALSLTKSNTSVANEIYDMLRYYPTSVRYGIYAEWFEGQVSRLPAMKLAFARTKQETLGTMKRISTTNVTSMARALAKIAYASPGVVFSVALAQIEAYTNLTEVVVECAKYFTDLGYDVLVWSLMSALGGKNRNRNNAEFALLPSKWLLALSRFSGRVFRRYSIMNPSPILQYVSHQLLAGSSTDLVILKELIAHMAGVVTDTDFNDAQRTAMTGGELLRKQTLINLGDLRFESTKTAKRLMKALTESNLAGQLLISIAQHRQSAIYSIPDEDAHIKMLATMIDDTHSTLTQYLDLLRSNLPVDAFNRCVPSIPEMLADFGLDPPLAFMIGRASIAYQLSKLLKPLVNGASRGASGSSPPVAENVDKEGDVGMEDPSDVRTDVQQNTANTTSTIERGGITSDYTVQVQAADVVTSPTQSLVQDILEPIISTVETHMPEGYWTTMSPEFYVTFWTSTLSDIAMPSKSYDTEISRLLKEHTDLMRDRTDMTKAGVQRKEETKKVLEATRTQISAECLEHMAEYQAKKARLLKRKAFWFEHFKDVKADQLSDSMLEKCLLPRLLLSPSDADFCYKIIRFLHDNGTPNFRTLSMLGRIFKPNRLRSVIFTCTIREAENLGRFLRLILQDLARWHSSKSSYEKEALGPRRELIGFAKTVDEHGKPKALLEHEHQVGFKNILLTWHKALNAALRDCLDGTEWMHIRNAITVLKSVVDVFPVIDFMGNNFVKQLENIAKREKDTREDLSLTANAVLVQLKMRSKAWVMVQAFGYNLANGSPSRQPAQGAAKSVLKPTAPEFKPQSRASSISAPTPKPSVVGDVEDGEVDDSRKPSVSKDTTSTSTFVNDAKSSSDIKANTSTPPAKLESNKSDILVKREQVKKETAARVAAQAAAAASNTIAQRPELARNPSSSTLSSLPNRPDAPIPRLDRHSGSRHEGPRDNRDLRTLGGTRDRSRDLTGDRRLDPNSRDFGRAPNRSNNRARPEPPPRWSGDSTTRNNNDRPSLNGGRDSGVSGRFSRDGPMPPPKQPAPPERPSVTTQDKYPPVNPERQGLINPERAALIHDNKVDSRSNSPRSTKDDPRDRTSRGQSPKPPSHEREHADMRRDERPHRNGPSEPLNKPTHGRSDDSQPPPMGPRNERPGDRPTERNPADRRVPPPFQPSQPPSRPPMDLEHGRLSRQPESSYGRLNQVPDIPSGPRDRNARNNRMASAPQPRLEGRVAEASRALTPEKQPPTGPSSSRARRAAPGQVEDTTASTAPPSIASQTLPSPTMHPDRMKHFSSLLSPPPPVQPIQHPEPPVNSIPTGMHPDRAKAFGGEPESRRNMPAPFQSNSVRPEPPSHTSGGPPAGPRGAHNDPATPRMNGIAAPTGPASATERAVRVRRPKMHEINSHLQENNMGQDRGRSRRSAGQPGTPISGPSTPVLAPPPPPPPARSDHSGRDIINLEGADFTSTPSSEDRNRGERDRNSRHERGHRGSRRSSRSPDRGREPKRGPGEGPDEGRNLREEYRDCRPSEREITRDHKHGPRDIGGPRELIEGRDTGFDGIGRGGRAREPRRDHRERDAGGREQQHDAPWSGGGDRGGRGWDPRGDGNRRDMRGSRDEGGGGGGGGGGRKRRSEGDALDGRGHEKRMRR